MECQKINTDIRKHGEMRRLLKDLGKRRQVWKLEERKHKNMRKEYKKSRQNAKRIISSAKEKNRKQVAMVWACVVKRR